MTPVLELKIEGNRLYLTGRIDEHTDLSRQAADLLAKVGEIDLGGLTRINSIGVREWMDFSASFPKEGMRLLRCAPVFVDQLNAIANFAGTAEVVSVLSAFECDKDGEVSLVEVQTTLARAGGRAAAPSCPRCGSRMVVAADDELFYRFLKYTR